MGQSELPLCLMCGKRVTYHIESHLEEMDHRGVWFCYEELDAICDECGGEIYTPETNDENASRREAAYLQEASA